MKGQQGIYTERRKLDPSPPSHVAANSDSILLHRLLEVLEVALEVVDARSIVKCLLKRKISLAFDRHAVPVVSGRERAK